MNKVMEKNISASRIYAIFYGVSEWESDEGLLTRFCDCWKINDAHLIPIIRAHKNTATAAAAQD